MTARIINLLGVPTASRLVPAAPDNVRGFWEPAAVVDIHNALLRDLGSSSDDPLPLAENWMQSAAATTARAWIVQFIESEFRDSSSFVVKDPRIGRVLPLWLSVLETLRIEPLIVIPFRNPLEVAGSLKRRDRFALCKALLLYVETYLDAEAATRGCARTFVSFDAILSDWRVLEAKIRQHDVAIPPLTESATAKIEEFLSAELLTHRASRRDLCQHPAVPRSVVELYDLLEAISRDGPESTVWTEQFDRLRIFVNDAALLYRELLLAERDVTKQQLNQYESSKSWQITAPLRWAARSFSRS